MEWPNTRWLGQEPGPVISRVLPPPLCSEEHSPPSPPQSSQERWVKGDALWLTLYQSPAPAGTGRREEPPGTCPWAQSVRQPHSCLRERPGAEGSAVQAQASNWGAAAGCWQSPIAHSSLGGLRQPASRQHSPHCPRSRTPRWKHISSPDSPGELSQPVLRVPRATGPVIPAEPEQAETSGNPAAAHRPGPRSCQRCSGGGGCTTSSLQPAATAVPCPGPTVLPDRPGAWNEVGD